MGEEDMKYTVVGTCEFRDCEGSRQYPWVRGAEAESPKEAAALAVKEEVGEDDPPQYVVRVTYVFEGAHTPLDINEYGRA
jgi:hypothetical protein